MTSLLQVDGQEKLPTGQCRPRVPPSPINLKGDAYLGLQKTMSQTKVRAECRSCVCSFFRLLLLYFTCSTLRC